MRHCGPEHQPTKEEVKTERKDDRNEDAGWLRGQAGDLFQPAAEAGHDEAVGRHCL